MIMNFTQGLDRRYFSFIPESRSETLKPTWKEDLHTSLAIYRGAGMASGGSTLDAHAQPVGPGKSNQRSHYASEIQTIWLSSTRKYGSLGKILEDEERSGKKAKVIHQLRYQVKNHMKCMLPRTLSFVSIK